MAVSEDDNVLVNGVSGERDAMGFFGYAYYQANKDKLRAIPIVNPTTDKAVLPTSENIESGTYAPFSRPLFLYVNRRSARRPEVRAFVEYYLRECPKLASEVGYVRLPEAMYERSRANFASRKAGTQFLDESGNMVTGALTKVYQ
jgi:phosphate transport system substrate-binding protein